MKLKPSMRYVAILAALCVLNVGVSGCISDSGSSGSEFITGQNHPQAILDLQKNGTVVIFFTQNNCPECDRMKPKVAQLQSELHAKNVTIQGLEITTQSKNITKQPTNLKFVWLNVDDSALANSIGSFYGIKTPPVIIVVRSDGAVVKKIGEQSDLSAVKNAIEDALKWK